MKVLKPLFFGVCWLFSISISALELRPGDLLLQSVRCWVCSLIELETQSRYSHIAMVYAVDKDKVKIAEAYFPRVQLIELDEFLFKTNPNTKIKILRSKQAISVDQFQAAVQTYVGLSYDDQFEFETDIVSKIYCSELVYRVYNDLNLASPALKPMNFERYYDYWEQYFTGEVPSGKLGVAPADFDQSDLFETMGNLNVE
jgi:hypothetical protein